MIEPLINYELLIFMTWSPLDEAMTSADIDFSSAVALNQSELCEVVILAFGLLPVR